MQIQRNLMLFSLIAAASLILAGCGSDSDNPATTTGPTGNPIVDPVTGNPIVDPVTGNPVVDPAVNPVVDPAGNPVVDPAGNPVVDPAGNPVVDPAGNPVVDPTGNPPIVEPPTPDAPTIGDKPTAPQQIVLGECGSLPVSSVVASANAASPANMLLETLVEGRLDPDSLSNQEHYWTIDLAPGRYNLVMDTSTVSTGSSNIGVNIFATTPGQEEVILIQSNEIDHKVRKVGYFEVVRSATISLRVAPVFGAEDYVFGVFTNSTPIPSPFFEDCPVFTPLPLDTTNSFLIPTIQNAGVGEKWFEVDLAVGDHTLSVDASFPDGQSTNLQLSAYWYDQYGQVDRINRVIGFNEIAATFSGSGPIKTSDPGKVWIRFINPNPDMSVTTTLTRD